MENYIHKYQNLFNFELLEILVLILFGAIIFANIYRFKKFSHYKTKLKEEKNKKCASEKEEVIINTSKLKNGVATLDLLDSLISHKFEYYLYRDLLPRFIGNELNKRESFKKEDFKELKDKFFIDIKNTISKNTFDNLIYIMSPVGLELYIHQKFSTLFNKLDAKFFESGEEIKGNMFFMSDEPEFKKSKNKKED